MNLSTGQQNNLKYLFRKTLIHLVPNLFTLNIDNLHLQKVSVLLIVLCDDFTYLRQVCCNEPFSSPEATLSLVNNTNRDL